MRRIPALAYLAAALLLFWLMLAAVMITSGFPFMVITLSLSSILGLSVVVVGLAWAYKNNI
jgi:hypothetical protein